MNTSTESSVDEMSVEKSVESIERSIEELRLEETNELTNDGNPSSTRPSGVSNKEYVFDSTHIGLEAAKRAIDLGQIGNQYWTRGNTYTTKHGDKICYTCRSFSRCPKKMYLLLDPENLDVHAHVSTDEHDHDLSGKFRLNPISKQKVLELLGCGVIQPRKILKELDRHNLPPLTKLQINNLKARLKNKVFIDYLSILFSNDLNF